MLKKFMLTAAAGATVFGVAAASAAALGIAATRRTARRSAQQSDAISAVCDSNGVEPFIQVANGGERRGDRSVNFNTNEINPSCNGSRGPGRHDPHRRQGSSTASRSASAARSRPRVADLNLTLPANVLAKQIATTTVTFADEINGPASRVRHVPLRTAADV
jgi:hypothetical protein